MSRSDNARKRTAFTLIELLVVIAIISLLISILVPSLSRAKDLAKLVLCASNQHNIGIGLILYADENDEYLPRGYSNPAMHVWYREAIEAIATVMGSFNDDHPMFGPYGFDLTPRFGEQFVCPSTKYEPRPIYGYPIYDSHPPRAVTSYFLVTMCDSYEVGRDVTQWEVEPLTKTTQSESIVDKAYPLADFILADALTWRFGTLLHHNTPYWYGGHHTAQFVMPDDDGDPRNIDAISNCLYLDTHVEQHDAGELTSHVTSTGEEHWH